MKKDPIDTENEGIEKYNKEIGEYNSFVKFLEPDWSWKRFLVGFVIFLSAWGSIVTFIDFYEFTTTWTFLAGFIFALIWSIYAEKWLRKIK